MKAIEMIMVIMKMRFDDWQSRFIIGEYHSFANPSAYDLYALRD